MKKDSDKNVFDRLDKESRSKVVNFKDAGSHLDSIDKILSRIEIKLTEHDRRFDSIEEKLSLIPILLGKVEKVVAGK